MLRWKYIHKMRTNVKMEINVNDKKTQINISIDYKLINRINFYQLPIYRQNEFSKNIAILYLLHSKSTPVKKKHQKINK